MEKDNVGETTTDDHGQGTLAISDQRGGCTEITFISKALPWLFTYISPIGPKGLYRRTGPHYGNVYKHNLSIEITFISVSP